jgi:hypothetical protein
LTGPYLDQGIFDASIVILTPLNKDAHQINEAVPGKLQSSNDESVVECLSIDCVCENLVFLLFAQLSFGAPCISPGLSPRKLKLKIGIPIILLRKLNPRQGICNGPRLSLGCFYASHSSRNFDRTMKRRPSVDTWTNVDQLRKHKSGSDSLTCSNLPSQTSLRSCSTFVKNWRS